jgi:hypothetical protein
MEDRMITLGKKIKVNVIGTCEVCHMAGVVSPIWGVGLFCDDCYWDVEADLEEKKTQDDAAWARSEPEVAYP